MWARIAIAAGVAWAACAGPAQARPFRVGQIPNGSVNSCANCHVNPGGGGPRNAFGQTVETQFLSEEGASGNVLWGAALAGIDSDGDGASNGLELGDPDGDGAPTAGAQVTNPGDSDSTPSVPNRAPEVASVDTQVVAEGEALSFTVTATDPDGDPLSITAEGLPEGAAFTDGRFEWTPGFDQGGSTYTVTVSASDGDTTAAEDVAIRVTDVDRPVVILSTSPAEGILVAGTGEEVSLTVSAEDPDGDPLMYAWTVNGAARAQTGSSFVHTVTEGEAADTVSVSVSSNGAPATRTWTVEKSVRGDFDGNGAVTFQDFLAFARVYGSQAGDPDFDARFDLNGNDRIDFPDFLEFVRFYGLSGA